MYHCVPCHRQFLTWTPFKRHMLGEHLVNERSLVRRVAQLDAGDVYAVRSEHGSWFMMGQASML